MRSSLFRKVALAAQIAALLLVQFYGLVPSLSLAFATPHRSGLCRGNHVECGCSPERIASRTCCCYRQKPGCCDLDNHHGDAPAVGQRTHNTPVPPSLGTAPCGSSANFVPPSVQQLKFVLSDTYRATLPGSFLLLLFPVKETASSRVAEPPDPPPRLMNS